ncbi:MAG: DUF126 domain-containing protein [Bacilli bacterium]|nr:DUF126 domain-containing protein [Bacilli bacterium]
MKEFKGRVITPGEWMGKAIVTKEVVNMMDTFYTSAYKKNKQAVGGDPKNSDLYGKVLTGNALCLPHSKASAITGLVIQTICEMKISPAAYLFSNSIDEVAASGIILAKIWEDSEVICIDNLGSDFLDAIKTDDEIKIEYDGTVKIIDKDDK